jgi:hypothetical protein
MDTFPHALVPYLAGNPETGKTIKIFSGFLLRLPFQLCRLRQPFPHLLQLVRVGPVDQPLHLFRRRLFPGNQEFSSAVDDPLPCLSFSFRVCNRNDLFPFDNNTRLCSRRMASSVDDCDIYDRNSVLPENRMERRGS